MVRCYLKWKLLCDWIEQERENLRPERRFAGRMSGMAKKVFSSRMRNCF
jgi:hypothetical protein